MKQLCNEHIKESLDLVRNLIILADEGERDSRDDGCRLLYGVIRDCAYKIKNEAERERNAHEANNKWD
ncbi:MAG: hypothetical protein KOO69_01480 [Victivallales bacterium]|nr:hypothetical protein [Victivallales bacterium]